MTFFFNSTYTRVNLYSKIFFGNGRTWTHNLWDTLFTSQISNLSCSFPLSLRFISFSVVSIQCLITWTLCITLFTLEVKQYDKNKLRVGEAPWSGGERQGLTVWAMVLIRVFNSRVHLKSRWIWWTTWWQKRTKIIKVQVTLKNIKKTIS